MNPELERKKAREEGPRGAGAQLYCGLPHMEPSKASEAHRKP